MRTFLSLFLIIFVSLTSGAVAQSLENRDWGVVAHNSLNANPPSKNDVKVFVYSHLNSSDNTPVLCSSAFVDLSNTGTYSLIVSIDESGRHFCNKVAFFSKSQIGFQVQELPAWEADNVAKLVRSLDGRNVSQLVLKEPFTPYQGVRCMAAVDRVYELHSGQLVNTSSKYPFFYKTQLSQLVEKMKADVVSDSTCSQLEVDKLKRMLGISPVAGFALAETMSKSPDPYLRSKAVAVFADIGDKASLDQIMHMVADPDASVAFMAKQTITSQPLH